MVFDILDNTIFTMTNEAQIYAKEQQIKLIDNILFSLCTIELTPDGRKYLMKMKDNIVKDIESLKSKSQENSHLKKSGSGKYKFKFPLSIKFHG